MKDESRLQVAREPPSEAAKRPQRAGDSHLCGVEAPGCPLFEILQVDAEDAVNTRWARAWGLPPRCAMVAALMMRGLRDRDIANQLGLATTSVRTYARSVLSRAAASSRVELIHNALRLWLPP